MADPNVEHFSAIPPVGSVVDLEIMAIPPIKLGYPATADTPELAINVHILDAWEVYQAIEKINVDTAAIIGSWGMQFMAAVQPPTPERLHTLSTISGASNLYGFMHAVLRGLQEFQRGKTLEENVILFTYEFLRQKKLTRDDAARIATHLLKRDPPITSEAWRKRVDRYVEQRRDVMTRVGQRKPKNKRK